MTAPPFSLQIRVIWAFRRESALSDTKAGRPGLANMGSSALYLCYRLKWGVRGSAHNKSSLTHLRKDVRGTPYSSEIVRLESLLRGSSLCSIALSSLASADDLVAGPEAEAMFFGGRVVQISGGGPHKTSDCACSASGGPAGAGAGARPSWGGCR